MPYAEYPPPTALQQTVRCFWSIDDVSSTDIQEVWPDGCIELLFHPGNCFLVQPDGSEHPFPKPAVIGLQTSIMRVRTDGPVRILAARMLPLPAFQWEPESLRSLSARIEPLLLSSDFPAAVKILGTWLLQQPRLEDPFASTLHQLYAGFGSVTVAELADAQGVSTRQLQRSFSEKLGIPPKSVARLVRFARSWAILLNQPDISLADLALELGYSDQAHFSNEFRSFGNQSPQAFRRTWNKP